VWLPPASEEVEKAAWPLLTATGVCAVPSIVKVTVPLGVPEPGATTPTAAVSVSGCPNTVGAAGAETVVVVAALVTVWTGSRKLLLKWLSPLYSMEISWAPTLSVEMVKVAWPLMTATGFCAVPSTENVTVPVIVPVFEITALTDAVNEIGCPKTDGSADTLKAMVVSVLFTT
jgi:hypothetical protein